MNLEPPGEQMRNAKRREFTASIDSDSSALPESVKRIIAASNWEYKSAVARFAFSVGSYSPR